MVPLGVSRRLSVSPLAIEQSQTSCVQIVLDGEGGENALGFSLGFNTNFLSFVSARLGDGMGGAALNVNQLVAGRVGLALALPPGVTLPRQRSVIAEICMRATALTNPVATAIALVDQPIWREIDDDKAIILPAGYADGTVTIASGSDCRFEAIRLEASGHVKVRLIGQAGVIWNLQTSSDLQNWQTTDNLTNSTGVLEYEDTTATTSGHRFYRLKFLTRE
jgi:hypothetical protein